MAETNENKDWKDASKYPEPTNQDYLSYYVKQKDYKPGESERAFILTQSPGPAIVNLPPTIGEEGHDYSRYKAPGYKIGIRTPVLGDKRYGPGPSAYDTRNVTNQGVETSTAPKLGKAERFDHRQFNQSPGPAVYNRDLGDKHVYRCPPAYSMPHTGRRDRRIPQVPGPNQYTLPLAMGLGKTPLVLGPSYSMGKAERSGLEAKCQSPGPGLYMLPSSDVFMPKAPAYFMTKRPEGDKRGLQSPGPALYKVHLVKYDKSSAPRFTFGIRHSPFKANPGFESEQ